MWSVLTLCCSLTVGQPALTDSSFASVRDAIVPTKAELRWRELPWRVTLWDAVREGQRERKPILLFAMNGHPCGST